ncbi:hypothetical protein GCM10009827_029810 [Dactylosporangium maewongense]|uniref:Uncharacterized protein n=1 Tax=Dactylosporangium maewongense TaxID=634393 RepID=A0ABN2A7S2_9ACTN
MGAAARMRALRRRVRFVAWRVVRPWARASANSDLARERASRRRANSAAVAARRAVPSSSAMGKGGRGSGADNEKYGRGIGGLPLADAYLNSPGRPTQRPAPTATMHVL